jgi:hypothetical protein
MKITVEQVTKLKDGQELQVNTNLGSVVIQGKDFNFCYLGKFGANVLNAIIKHKANGLSQKLEVLNIHKEVYSHTVGGVTIITLK